MVLKCPLGEAAEDAPRDSEPSIAVSLCWHAPKAMQEG